MKAINLGLRFLLELMLLASIGYSVFQFDTGIWRWIFAIGAVLLIAMIWGIWIAPHSGRRLADPWRFGMELLLFGIGFLGLWITRHPSVSSTFAVLFVVNLVLMITWHQRQ